MTSNIIIWVNGHAKGLFRNDRIVVCLLMHVIRKSTVPEVEVVFPRCYFAGFLKFCFQGSSFENRHDSEAPIGLSRFKHLSGADKTCVFKAF